MTAGDLNKDDWDNAVNFYSLSNEGFTYQVWDVGSKENKRDNSYISLLITDIAN